MVYFQNGLRVMVYYLPPGQTRYKSHPGKLKHNKQALYNKHIKVDSSHIDCQFAVIAKITSQTSPLFGRPTFES